MAVLLLIVAFSYVIVQKGQINNLEQQIQTLEESRPPLAVTDNSNVPDEDETDENVTEGD